MLLNVMLIYCQSSYNDSRIPIVGINYTPLSDILQQVIDKDVEEKYYSDTLNYMIHYSDTIFSNDIILDTAPSYTIESGVPLFLFVVTPCPDGLPTANEETFRLLKFNGHLFLLINHKESRFDSILFTQPSDSIAKAKLFQTEPMEDDRWHDYFFYSSTDSKGLLFWRKHD